MANIEKEQKVSIETPEKPKNVKDRAPIVRVEKDGAVLALQETKDIYGVNRFSLELITERESKERKL